MQNCSGKNDSFLVLDIGGTLSKLCFVTDSAQTNIPHDPRLTIKLQHKTIFFNYFKVVDECWKFIHDNFVQDKNYSKFVVTGGGAYKYSEEFTQIEKKNNKKIVIVQEFQSLIGGLTFFKAHEKCDQFLQSYISTQDGNYKFQNRLRNYTEIQDCPILVVNIGSGVSILLVQKNQNNQLKAERVGGTSLGGGFFMGLANLLIGENNFHNLLQMAKKGDVKYTDFTPMDFPQIAPELNQASVLVSLGKLNNQSNPNDIAKSLFFMVTFNIAQIALSYSEITNVKHVLFTGFYCRDNSFFHQCFAEAFHFFSKKSSPKFVYSLLHDGFLGALGAVQLQLKQN